jgi:hypothetical protein
MGELSGVRVQWWTNPRSISKCRIVLARPNALKLATITDDRAQNIDFGIRSSVAMRLIEAKGVSMPTTGQAAIAPADPADKAKSVAVVECQRD